MANVKIYGTLGPACANRDMLLRMLDNGMDGLRLNLSHRGLGDSQEWIELMEDVRRASGKRLELLIDLQGPELRIGELKEEMVLGEGETVEIGPGERIPAPIQAVRAMEEGMELLLDDGKLALRVERAGEEAAQCRVLRGGRLSSRKSLSLPGVEVDMPTLTEMDRENLRLAGQAGVTGLMQPFVRGARDIENVRAAIGECHAGGLEILAKLENRRGLSEMANFAPLADEVVIARGDLGANTSLWELPVIQKRAAACLRKMGKRFMVVTQMLNSMIDSPTPTRAEVTDIAQAVLDGAASVMLTGETAVGKYPDRAIWYMKKTVEEAQRYRDSL